MTPKLSGHNVRVYFNHQSDCELEGQITSAEETGISLRNKHYAVWFFIPFASIMYVEVLPAKEEEE